jgi:hypothetical protein
MGQDRGSQGKGSAPQSSQGQDKGGGKGGQQGGENKK